MWIIKYVNFLFYSTALHYNIMHNLVFLFRLWRTACRFLCCTWHGKLEENAAWKNGWSDKAGCILFTKFLSDYLIKFCTLLDGASSKWLTNWLCVNWLTDWLSHWLTSLLAGWLADCHAGWLAGWLTLTNWPTVQLTDSLTDSLADRPTKWLTDSLTHSLFPTD